LGLPLLLAVAGAVGYEDAVPRSLRRAPVVKVFNSQATKGFVPDAKRLPEMVQVGLTNLLRTATTAEAWASLVSTQDVVGLKVFSAPGSQGGTRPAVVAAVVESLLDFGLPANQIVIWDRRRADLEAAGYLALAARYGVRVGGSAEAGYDERTYFEKALLGRLVYGDLKFGQDDPVSERRSYVSNLVSRELTKIISITPLLNHNYAGVSGAMFSLALGSVDNWVRFERKPDQLAEAVPEIMALDVFYDGVVLCIVDALVCQYQGETQPLLHYSVPLKELWFGWDPVALDVLAMDEVQRQQEMASTRAANTNRVILSNAALLELGQANRQMIDVQRVRIQ